MPGEGNSSDPHPQGTWEILHVTAGTLTLTVDGAAHRVPAGSSVAFAADAPHAYRNEDGEAAEFTMAVSVPGCALSLTPAPGSRSPDTGP